MLLSTARPMVRVVSPLVGPSLVARELGMKLKFIENTPP